MQKFLENRNAILWDFDGVLYSNHFSGIPYEAVNENFLLGNAKGTQELLPWLSDDEAYRMGHECFLTHHDSITIYIPYAVKLGMPEDEFKNRLLQAQLKSSLKNFLENLPQLFAPCAETNNLFERLSPHVKHSIITHSNAEYWAWPVAQNLGVAPYMNEILGYDDFDFQSKGKSAHAVTTALDQLGVQAETAIFVEDQMKHLQIAKETYPEICCVFIEGPEPVEQPEFVDIMVKRPKDFLKVMAPLFDSKKDAA